jgi:hypothetical protein
VSLRSVYRNGRTGANYAASNYGAFEDKARGAFGFKRAAEGARESGGGGDHSASAKGV